MLATCVASYNGNRSHERMNREKMQTDRTSANDDGVLTPRSSFVAVCSTVSSQTRPSQCYKNFVMKLSSKYKGQQLLKFGSNAELPSPAAYSNTPLLITLHSPFSSSPV